MAVFLPAIINSVLEKGDRSMARPAFTEAQIIQKTLENVRSFYNRKREIAALPMADDFVWIGAYDSQWSEGQDQFIELAGKENEEFPFLLSDEEYHLLFHERNVWVVYGHYKVTATMENGTVFHAHVRGTYVWRMVNGELKLAHVHESHGDMPMSQMTSEAGQCLADVDFLEYMKHMDMRKANQEKIVFRDKEKNYHYLFPSDILYLKVAVQYSIVHTKTDSFKTWGLLADFEKKVPETFRRIHKSYLVNTMYIDSVRRYRASLTDGQELPIGKERYMELKKHLQNGI